MVDTTANDQTTNGEELEIVALDVGTINRRSLGWWGMWTLIITEAFLFAYLLFSYYYMASQNGQGFIPRELPSFRLSGPNTIILIVSSVCVWFGEEGVKKEKLLQGLAGIGVAIVLGAIFVGIQLKEWADKPFTLSSHPYGSLFFTVTGFHMAHVVAGLIVLGTLFVWTALRYFNAERHAPVSIGAMYWHFVDVVWLTVFFTFYITPYLMT